MNPEFSVEPPHWYTRLKGLPGTRAFLKSLDTSSKRILCFSCGRLGHTQGNCCYSIKPCEKGGEVGEASKEQNVGQLGDTTTIQDVGQDFQPSPNYGPWMLVTRKRSLVRNGRGSNLVKENSGSEGYKGKTKYQVFG